MASICITNGCLNLLLGDGQNTHSTTMVCVHRCVGMSCLVGFVAT